MTQVTHVVLVSWTSGRAAAVEESIRPAIRAFGDTIPGIVTIVEGHSSSPEGLEDGHDYGFVVTFDSADARDSYLADSRHRVVADAISDSAQHIVVFDI
jgi:Stress responsive A/B Barrel Domain